MIQSRLPRWPDKAPLDPIMEERRRRLLDNATYEAAQKHQMKPLARDMKVVEYLWVAPSSQPLSPDFSETPVGVFVYMRPTVYSNDGGETYTFTAPNTGAALTFDPKISFGPAPSRLSRFIAWLRRIFHG